MCAERRSTGRSQDDLIPLLVHDLRGPLFGISGNLHLILALARNLSEEALTSVKVALDFTRDMEEMLRCMADVPELEAGTWPLQPALCDVGELVDRAVTTLAALAHEKRHTVAWSRTATPHNCDPELIRRVALNLLRNALEATPSGGRIEIRLEHLAGGLRVSVNDNGPGVPDGFQALVFEKCGQTPEGQRVKRRSSGLGLVFCKLAVEAHGGTIGLESPPGQGCTFWFDLPAARDSGSSSLGR